MKTYLTALLSFLIAPVLAFGALDVSMGGSSVITVGGINLTVSDTATLDYITVNSDSFDVRLSPGSTITVSSADRKALAVTPTSGYTTANTCTSGASSITLDMPATHPGPYIVLTVTPSSSACDASSGGGSPGATSGGGGGGGGSVPTPVYTVIPGTTSSAASVASSASSASPGATVTQATTGQTITKTISTPSGIIITITKTLKVGSQNSEVRSLQQALAQDKTIYPEGKVTGYFGALTKKAVQNFQKKSGIEPVGYVGPQTRKKLNEVYGKTAASSSTQASSAASATSSAAPATGSTGVTTSATAKAQQIQQIQALINQLLEQVKALQAKKATQ